MADAELVTRKLLLILRELDALRRIQAGGLDAYLSSRLDQAVAERHLERIIGRMIDVNYHLLTSAGHPPPSDYHASFLQMAPLGVLPSEFAHRLAASAGLRNRIVHEYDELDQKRIFDALDQARLDVPANAEAVNHYLTRHASDP
jgi:uncharacterized protein YutE (UPF0331/DUF86 family)